MSYLEVVRFMFGLAAGSFLNVVSLRYAPERPVFSREHFRGRSHCPYCGKTLRWFELIPLLSFALQAGKCRVCRGRLSLQYPAAELGTGLLFFLLPRALQRAPGFDGSFILTGLFLAAASVLILIALIDLRLRIIPDALNAALAILGVAIAAFLAAQQAFGPLSGSFFGHYGLLFGLRESIWINRLIAALAGGGFFAMLVLITRGRAMGMGDVKFAAALGVLLGWPDAPLALLLSFIIGAIVSLPCIARGALRMKSAVPFGPYMVAGAFVVMLWGYAILRWCFSLLPG